MNLSVKAYLLLGVSLVLISACATVPSGRVVERLPESAPAAPVPPPLPPLTRADLSGLAAQGLSADSLIGRLRDSHTRLRLSASDVLTLKAQGLPLAVIDHLLDSDRQASADECTAQLLKKDETLQQQVQQAELQGWQRCQLSQPMFPMWRFPSRR